MTAESDKIKNQKRLDEHWDDFRHKSGIKIRSETEKENEMDTEILDKLYLELSQISKAKTTKEIGLDMVISRKEAEIKKLTNCVQVAIEDSILGSFICWLHDNSQTIRFRKDGAPAQELKLPRFINHVVDDGEDLFFAFYVDGHRSSLFKKFSAEDDMFEEYDSYYHPSITQFRKREKQVIRNVFDKIDRELNAERDL